MKHLNRLLSIFFLAMTALLASCSEDEDKLPKEITIDGEEITLSNGYIVGYGSDVDDNGDQVSDYRIVLTEEGIVADEGSFSGNGTAIWLYLVSPLPDALKDGDYTFEFDEEYVKNNVYGYIYYNWDVTGATVDEYYGIKSGTLKLTKSGKTFKIKITNLVLVKDSDGSEVEGKGSWEGGLDDKGLVGVS